jgi:hypothetical protein
MYLKLGLVGIKYGPSSNAEVNGYELKDRGSIMTGTGRIPLFDTRFMSDLYL